MNINSTYPQLKAWAYLPMFAEWKGYEHSLPLYTADNIAGGKELLIFTTLKVAKGTYLRMDVDFPDLTMPTVEVWGCIGNIQEKEKDYLKVRFWVHAVKVGNEMHIPKDSRAQINGLLVAEEILLRFPMRVFE